MINRQYMCMDTYNSDHGVEFAGPRRASAAAARLAVASAARQARRAARRRHLTSSHAV